MIQSFYGDSIKSSWATSHVIRSLISDVMVVTEMVPERLVSFDHLTWLMAQEDFTHNCLSICFIPQTT
jgi:hypothetical protein